MPVNLKTNTKFRFVLVGGANTAIDFGTLFILRALGLPAISANVISTTLAFCFSFFANKNYTFKSNSSNVKRELLLFVIVTLFGLWVIQSGLIALLLPVVAPLGFSEDITLLVAKVLATLASLTWNYLMYSRVVFKRPTDDNHHSNE